MNILKAGVKGKFIFSDPVTKEKIAEFKNDISDYGMQRLAGFRNHNAYAVAENFEFIHLGESDEPVNRFGIFKLIQPLIPSTDVTIVHGSVADAGIVPSPTRTEYTRDAVGNVVVRFTNNWDVTFNRNVVIREVGASHVNYRGSARSRGVYGFNFNTDDPARVNLQDNINQSLFSRAVLSPSQPFSNGQSVRVTYVCEITLCPEVEWIENLLVDNSTLPSPAPSDIFPESKINMRQKPFYDLASNGKSSDYFVVAGSNVPDTGVKTCPFLDSFAEPPRGVWILDSYLLDFYNTFTNTMTATVLDGSTLIPSPVTSVRRIKNDGSPVPQSYATRHYPATSGYIVDHPSQDVWTTKIRFVLRSEDMPNSTAAELWTLWRAYDTNQQIPSLPSYRGRNGLTFALKDAFRPSANKLFGLDFTITWTR
jgi:hypothetical protein